MRETYCETCHNSSSADVIACVVGQQGRPPVIAEIAEGIGRMSASHGERDRLTGATGWDPSAFEEVFLGNYSRIVAVLQRLLGDRARAEELANEVFWKLYRQPVLPATEGNLPGWLYRSATNLGIDELRSRGKRKQYEEAARRMASLSGEPADPLSEI